MGKQAIASGARTLKPQKRKSPRPELRVAASEAKVGKSGSGEGEGSGARDGNGLSVVDAPAVSVHRNPNATALNRPRTRGTSHIEFQGDLKVIEGQVSQSSGHGEGEEYREQKRVAPSRGISRL